VHALTSGSVSTWSLSVITARSAGRLSMAATAAGSRVLPSRPCGAY